MKADQVLKTVRLTEKANKLSSELGQYTFEVAKSATYNHAYAQSKGFLTLLSDGESLTGAYALGPEAGEWLQQATLAIRAKVPLEVLRDTIQPFPTFSEIYVATLKSLHKQIRAAGQPS